MSTAVDDAALDRLLRIFHKQDDAGRPLYSRDDVRAFLPVLVFGARGSLEMSAALADIMSDFAALLELTPGMETTEVERRVRAHYEANPVSSRLLAEVKDLLREELLSGGGLDATATAKALGQRMAKMPVGHGTAPEGSTKASPLARFALGKDDEPTS